jgi:hypothetical protein
MSHSAIRQLALNLPVFFLKEKKAFIAYSPAIDLSASGSSTSNAKKNFERTLAIFLEELLEHGTLEQVLKELGWFKQERQWQPPVKVSRMTSVAFRLPVPA